MKTYAANELNQYTAIANTDAVGLRGDATNTAVVTVNGNAASRDTVASDVRPWHFALPADNANGPAYTFASIVGVVNPPGTNEADIVSTTSGSVYAPPQNETLTYDDDGNLLSDGHWQYTWNGENRLVCAEEQVCPTNRTLRKVDYAYDHQGRMVWKDIKHRDVEAQSWDEEKVTSYLWDNFNIIAETTVSDSATNTPYNIWGLDLDGTLQGAGGVGGLLAVVKDSVTYIPSYDANGNIMEYVSDDGSIAAHREYDPFGGTVVYTCQSAITNPQSTISFTHWFSTKPWCSITEISEYQYRKYDPVFGRWLNRDPIGERGGLNVGGYNCNNAVILIDTDGRQMLMLSTGALNMNYYIINAQIPTPPPYIPDTSDGFSFMEAFRSYYFGQGRDVTIPFNVIDQGYEVADFTRFDPCSYGVGTFDIPTQAKLHDLFTLRTLDQAGPGRINFSLDGSITMESNRKWSFSGQVTAGSEPFNFDPKEGFGERDGAPSWLQYNYEFAIYPLSFMSRYRLITYPKETITRFIHDLDQTSLRGQEFKMLINGSRNVTASGCCEK